MSNEDTAFQLFLGNEERDPKIEAEHPDLLNAKWVPAAKVGQVVDIKKQLCSVTAESLESSLGTWKGRKIFKNHETEIQNHIILGEKFENPFLSFLLDTEIVAALAKGGGGSIDAIATLVEEGKLRTMSGVGYSILDKDKVPACTKEAGCGIAAEGAAIKEGENVNIEGGITNPNIKPVVDEGELDKKEEDEKHMADKGEEKEEVSFSEAQVATIKAEAAKELTDKMTASHTLAMNDLETAHAAEIKTLGETHVTELETQREEVQKHVEMVESLSTKFALSPEAKTALIDAKSAEDVYTLLETLKVTKAEPVVAAEGANTTGCGIVLGSEIEGKAPETINVEQVGDYDPYTGKYVPSFREELK
jgi:hypothetical protein